jgi:hypothetical protein
MLRAGETIRTVALRFGLSKTSIGRHLAAHLTDGDNPTDDDGALGRLENAVRRLLARAEAKHDLKASVEGLRLLDSLQRRKRIAAASTEARTATEAQQPEPDERPRRDGVWLYEQLKQIYHLRGDAWETRIAARRDADTIEELTALASRRPDLREQAEQLITGIEGEPEPEPDEDEPEEISTEKEPPENGQG